MTPVDIMIFVGSFGTFLTLFLLFARFLPMIAMSEIKILEDLDFDDIAISVKAFEVPVMIAAYRRLLHRDSPPAADLAGQDRHGHLVGAAHAPVHRLRRPVSDADHADPVDVVLYDIGDSLLDEVTASAATPATGSTSPPTSSTRSPATSAARRRRCTVSAARTGPGPRRAHARRCARSPAS